MPGSINKLLTVSGTICALLWGFVTAMSYGLSPRWCVLMDRLTFGLFSDEVAKLANGFYYDISNKDMPTVMFLVLFAIIFALAFYVFLKVEKKPAPKHSLAIIIFFSIAFRIILLPGVLVHENDIYRYIWDGQAVAQGKNPFIHSPLDAFAADYIELPDEASLEVYNHINYPEIRTIYPPLVQGVFGLAQRISPWGLGGWRLIVFASEMGILLL